VLFFGFAYCWFFDVYGMFGLWKRDWPSGYRCMSDKTGINTLQTNYLISPRAQSLTRERDISLKQS